MAPKRKTVKKTDHTNHTTAYNTVGEMANDVRLVLKSVVAKNGQYSTQEASVVSKLYNSELTRMKLQVEIHKINNKSNKTSTTEVLSLT
tara:strand:- start:1110 stop:1376 length:267 start_codon:yes stop_codon:yes gene_type:complete